MSGFTMKKYLAYEMAFNIGSLDFLCSYVLTLLKFEYIFTPVDNFHSICTWKDHAYISCSKPTIRCDSLICFLFIFVIAHKNCRTSKPNLTSGCWSSLLIFILARIVHLLNISQLKFHTSLNKYKNVPQPHQPVNWSDQQNN